MDVLAILIILFKQALSLKTCLRWLHNSLYSPGVNKLLHLVSAFKNSSSKKDSQKEGNIEAILSRISFLMLRCRTILKKLWKACYKSLISRHGWLLNFITSMAGSVCLLTQFISFQEPCFLLAISWILRSKKSLLVFLTVLWKVFQFSRFFDNL